MSMI